jgi:hypothetical protein
MGELHYGRKQVQPAARDVREFYRHAATVLKYPLLIFAEAERNAIAQSFHQVIEGAALHVLWLRNHARPRPSAFAQTQTLGGGDDRNISARQP